MGNYFDFSENSSWLGDSKVSNFVPHVTELRDYFEDKWNTLRQVLEAL